MENFPPISLHKSSQLSSLVMTTPGPLSSSHVDRKKLCGTKSSSSTGLLNYNMENEFNTSNVRHILSQAQMGDSSCRERI